MVDPARTPCRAFNGMNLADRLKQQIAAQGPISIADYMTACLLDPKDGYYATRDPFGSSGDFITAPEISQMFGELIGLCLAQCWMDQGAPTPFTLAELGPGRGTLMQDILRATRGIPGFHAAAKLTLLDASPKLRDLQRSTLQAYAPTWIDSVIELPQGPLLLVANEFFDALPIRQFEHDGKGWRERHVGMSADNLTIGLGQKQPQPALKHRLADTKDGDVVEHCVQVAPIVETFSQRIEAHGGAALLIDYGDWRSLGDTLQAVQDHKSVDILKNPGAADLTAHVDFEVIARASHPAKYTKLCPQGVFLERLGITPRAERLAAGLSGAAREQHISAHRRLTHPAEMGTLFKVMGIYPSSASPPPGLDA